MVLMSFAYYYAFGAKVNSAIFSVEGLSTVGLSGLGYDLVFTPSSDCGLI